MRPVVPIFGCTLGSPGSFWKHFRPQVTPQTEEIRSVWDESQTSVVFKDPQLFLVCDRIWEWLTRLHWLSEVLVGWSGQVLGQGLEECSPLLLPPAQSRTSHGRHPELRERCSWGWHGRFPFSFKFLSRPHRLRGGQAESYYRRQDEMDIRCIIIASLVIIL